jgi:DHA2 family multidrug resistance protein-like MFS transporter
MEGTGSEAVPRATRREWLGLAILALPTLLTMMDMSVLILALPRLTADLGASATQQLWVTDIYGFLIAGFLVTMGTLGDRIGRRKVLLTGAAVFGLVSIFAAWSSSPEMLIFWRAVLGIAGATIMPSTLALIMAMFQNPKERGGAIAVWASVMTAGVALGPVVGGVLLEWFWWGSVFLIAVPIMVLLVALGPALLPEFKNPQAGRLDPVSVALSLLAILPFIWGFKEIARNGVEGVSVAAVVAGLVFGIVFVVRQQRLADPLLDLRLFAIRAVSGALVLSLLIAAVQGGVGLYMAQHLQLVKGLSPLETGLWILVPTFALILGIFVSQGIAQQVKPAFVLAAGLVVAAAGMFVLSQFSAATGLGMLLLAFSIVYVGVAPVGPLVSQLVVPSAPPEKAGSASALQSTSGELGVALGIAALGSVGVAAYRDQVSIPAEIAGTPAEAAATETVAGAIEVAQTLPAGVGQALADSAREAFTSGLTTAAGISVAAFLVLAVVAVATLRQVPPMTRPGGPPPDAAPNESAPVEAPVPD